MTGMREENSLTDRLRGRAQFCRDRQEIKTPQLLEQAASAIDRLSSQVEELKAGWQPIETAPRDGTSVLLAVEWKPKDVVGEAYWDVDMEEWWWMNTSPSDSTGEFVLPDYILGWRPLPAPPARSALSLEAGKE